MAAIGSSPPNAARRAGHAVHGEAVERVLEARHLLARVLHRPVDPGVGVHRRVECHRPQPSGEHARVRGAEHRAVGAADVRDLLLAHRGAQAVDVTRGVSGRDVGKRHRIALEAQPSELARVARDQAGIDVVRLGDARIGVRGRPAVDQPDAALVEGDEIEALVDRGEERRADGAHQADSRLARPAGPADDRSDPACGIGGGQLDHRDLDRAPPRARVVERDLEVGALEAAAAWLPVELGGRGAGWGGAGRECAGGERAGEERALGELHRRPSSSLDEKARPADAGGYSVESTRLARRRSYGSPPHETKEPPMPASLHYGLATDRPNSTRPQPRINWTRESPRPGRCELARRKFDAFRIHRVMRRPPATN